MRFSAAYGTSLGAAKDLWGSQSWLQPAFSRLSASRRAFGFCRKKTFPTRPIAARAHAMPVRAAEVPFCGPSELSGRSAAGRTLHPYAPGERFSRCGARPSELCGRAPRPLGPALGDFLPRTPSRRLSPLGRARPGSGDVALLTRPKASCTIEVSAPLRSNGAPDRPAIPSDSFPERLGRNSMPDTQNARPSKC
jgi:hypothetical protein